MGYVAAAAELLQVVMWLTPAGTVDEGGKEQPAYLNFDVALLGPPAGSEMQVILLPCTHHVGQVLRSQCLPGM